jgi:hypothetical protein
MTDEPNRLPPPPARPPQRRHELDIEGPAHPGDPRRVVSTDHEDCVHEPVPGSSPVRRREHAH